MSFIENRQLHGFVSVMNQRSGFTTDLVKSKYPINSSSSNDKVVATSHPLVFCSQLPQHWRSNKSLPTLFQVVVYQNVGTSLPIGDGYRVRLSAGNQSLNSAVLRNCESKLVNGEARFNDLRFISRSGRGQFGSWPSLIIIIIIMFRQIF